MNKFIMVIGLPASGKDTYIKKLIANSEENFVHLSSDKIREELYGSEEIQGNPKEVFSIMNKRVMTNLAIGNNIIYNATNICSKNRRNVLKEVKKYKDYMSYAVIIGTTFEQCLKNNEDRKNNGGRYIPPEVIKKMYYSFEPPHPFEGFNKIEVYYPFIPPYRDYKQEIKELKKVPHDCEPFHSYNIGVHINRAAKMAKEDIKKGKLNNMFSSGLADYYKSIIPTILFLHDLGKKETKVINSNGQAHYYNHENVGAYNYMFYLFDDNDLKNNRNRYDYNIAAAIAYHMRPFNMVKEKTKEKYKKLWGNDFYNLIKAVHIYDLKSEDD